MGHVVAAFAHIFAHMQFVLLVANAELASGRNALPRTSIGMGKEIREIRCEHRYCWHSIPSQYRNHQQAGDRPQMKTWTQRRGAISQKIQGTSLVFLGGLKAPTGPIQAVQHAPANRFTTVPGRILVYVVTFTCMYRVISTQYAPWHRLVFTFPRGTCCVIVNASYSI